jgi:hypothetical protein
MLAPLADQYERRPVVAIGFKAGRPPVRSGPASISSVVGTRQHIGAFLIA